VTASHDEDATWKQDCPSTRSMWRQSLLQQLGHAHQQQSDGTKQVAVRTQLATHCKRQPTPLRSSESTAKHSEGLQKDIAVCQPPGIPNGDHKRSCHVISTPRGAMSADHRYDIVHPNAVPGSSLAKVAALGAFSDPSPQVPDPSAHTSCSAGRDTSSLTSHVHPGCTVPLLVSGRQAKLQNLLQRAASVLSSQRSRTAPTAAQKAAPPHTGYSVQVNTFQLEGRSAACDMGRMASTPDDEQQECDLESVVSCGTAKQSAYGLWTEHRQDQCRNGNDWGEFVAEELQCINAAVTHESHWASHSVVDRRRVLSTPIPVSRQWTSRRAPAEFGGSEMSTTRVCLPRAAATQVDALSSSCCD
jgi:hypothetical protein